MSFGAPQSLQSSNVRQVRYDFEAQILEVQFVNGGTYHYAGVPAAIYEQLLNAKSAGSFLHQHVKNTYAGVKQ